MVFLTGKMTKIQTKILFSLTFTISAETEKAEFVDVFSDVTE